MTGSIPDPRLEAALRAVGALFHHDPEWYREGVACALAAADAHDGASGVRRVTGGFEARLMSLEFPIDQEVDDRGIDGLLATFDVPEGRKWRAGEYLIVPLSAADSPVGGVS